MHVFAFPSLKGMTRIYVDDQTHFKVGKIIIICELFMAQVVAFGSLVLDRPLDRDYPVGSPIREVTPTDDIVVDARGRTIINGLVMDPSSSSSGDNSVRDLILKWSSICEASDWCLVPHLVSVGIVPPNLITAKLIA